MPAYICGSLAFDTIMGFEGRFADQILPEQLHILNVSFLVPQLRRDFGGCAGNIAYALKALGGEPLPVAAVGPDAKDYLARFAALGIATDFVHEIDGTHTAQAMIMTDRDNNQITAFHPGAMSEAHRIRIEPRIQSGASAGAAIGIPGSAEAAIGIIAPDGRQAMLDHATQFAAAGIPFVFDPGQGLPMFGKDELLGFIDQASWIAVNDYEGKMLSDRTGLAPAALSRRVKGLVVTLGEQGCEVWTDGTCETVAPVKAESVVDPTGCGDAFRGALLYGLERGWPLAEAAALGNRLGALKIASRGPQNWTLPAELL